MWIEQERHDSAAKAKLESAYLMVQEFNHSVNEVAEKLCIPLKDLMDYIKQRTQQ
ncbi:hypothetical protein [Thiomicrospira sp. ALE5]|uniref:hypothetical protein n=1 Tax=Thiomicrospira sp. ALE5 TaxID=748650 RepID=UPI0008EE7A12|nr:hypothetical protein [Thiomicrospira sp. ALE5]SFR53564.1 hypothetical protein SAMN03092900_0880 [Thiomicrospira sp. ALE5]